MFSDKENIGILTNLLLRHNITEAVVCPGSRNAPIIHNLIESGINCHGITDERSAGFVAIGISLATNSPVAVCVTSGSALLNLMPAVAEASSRHIPLIVISADRPADRIGQLDGQTIPQSGAFSTYAYRSVDIPEPHDNASRRACCRFVNDALICAGRFPGHVVHINVPLSEPLFNYNRATIHDAEAIEEIARPATDASYAAGKIARCIDNARRPMIIVGQCPPSTSLSNTLGKLSDRVVTLFEPLACEWGGRNFDDVLAMHMHDERLKPDFVLFAGGTLVSKRLKNFLTDKNITCWAISADGDIHDIFNNISAVIPGDCVSVLERLEQIIGDQTSPSDFYHLWQECLQEAEETAENRSADPLNETVRILESELAESGILLPVHFANSSVVRAACRYAHRYCHVNRGVNGIEGSLSSAAGFSLSSPLTTVCVIGDLSFFYDNNALWNSELRGNLRILMINDGGGGIFSHVAGMQTDGKDHPFIAGFHNATAEGICNSYNVAYDSTDYPDRDKIRQLLRSKSDRPMLLEIKLLKNSNISNR